MNCDTCDQLITGTFVRRNEIDANFCSPRCWEIYQRVATIPFRCEFCGGNVTEPVQPRLNHNGTCTECRQLPDGDYEDQPRFTESPIYEDERF